MALELSNKAWRLLDAASIEASRKLRHVKSDRLDAESAAREARSPPRRHVATDTRDSGALRMRLASAAPR
jgi:transposase